jgi:uncharacterized protein
MAPAERQFAVVTGASTGIGLELARCAAREGCDLLIVADEREIENAAETLSDEGVSVQWLVANLATGQGVAALVEATAGRSTS